MGPINNPKGLSDCIYWPEFYSTEEAKNHFSNLRNSIEWKEHTYSWGTKMPRLTAFYGEGQYNYSGVKNEAKPFPAALLSIKSFLETSISREFNACLLNLYRNGNDSVAWHFDNEKDLEPKGTIASLSLGRTRTFYIRDKNKMETAIPLNSGDLFIMHGDFQETYMHAIKKELSIKKGTSHVEHNSEEHERINITFRNTIKLPRK